MKYKSDSHYTYSCRFQIVFCPKYRCPVLVDGVKDRLKEIISEYAKSASIDILRMEIMPDNVRLLLDCPIDAAPLAVAKSIKQRSANILKREFPNLKSRLPNLWTRNVFIATVGSVSLDVVDTYIVNQKKRR